MVTVELEATNRAPADAHEQAADPTSPEAPAVHARVLVVEDDPDSGEMLALFLSQHHYDVEVASSLSDGIGRLHESWDIILSDIGLPDGSGLEIARQARQTMHPPPRLIAFTGYGSGDDIRASRDAGFDDHVVKPIDPEKLLLTLAGRSRVH
jgi:DNA-binding response OmpR family regulator